jgi:hypothetical protein
MERREDIKLKHAVQKHGKKAAIAALVPGRTRNQCHSRWHNAWIPASTGECMYGYMERKRRQYAEGCGTKKSTVARIAWIAAMVPSRTKQQCRE